MNTRSLVILAVTLAAACGGGTSGTGGTSGGESTTGSTSSTTTGTTGTTHGTSTSTTGTTSAKTSTASSTGTATGTHTGTTTGTATVTGTATSGTTTSSHTTGTSGTGTTGSTTAATTAGSTTGTGTTGGACTPDGGGTDEALCASNADCDCPLVCVNDPTFSPLAGGNICSYACHTNQDCPDPFTVCQGGVCLTDPCTVAAGEKCNAADAGDGTCENFSDSSGDQVPLCVQGGTATTACDPAAERTEPTGLCGPGVACVEDDVGDGGTCQTACQPGDGGCPSGQACVDETDNIGVVNGLCFATGDGGCINSGSFTELQPCTTGADCNCPESCVTDPGSGNKECMEPCSASSDCLNAVTTCSNHACAPTYCVATALQTSAPGAGYGQPCDSLGSGDGVCELQEGFSEDDGGNFNEFAYGYCEQSGTSSFGNECSQEGQRDAGNELCVPGTECGVVPSAGFAFLCEPACNPLSDGGCGPGDGCFTQISGSTAIPAADVGVCGTCSTSGNECTFSSECCTGKCDQDAGGFCD